MDLDGAALRPQVPAVRPAGGGLPPFAVGYVELPEGVRVAAVLDGDLDAIRIGAPYRIEATGGVPRATAIGEA
ncbi:OB-fold domain-containing protein [Phytohabitans rumicis]|uniref:ChsH2 C-terminal OB-fold domain-containing protein n=1 Tax=Phytohabitans rumicis TaxID=1076125 RepID=A0A6V8KXC0_9ACTN|nr:OB-fold domain-containing protein [Phytohabitans rumicis]GFJ86486.1 hypothetical protein Prum_001280 [Phytohabitans rumicis]